MIPYILSVGLILGGCLAFYKILLRKETFYKFNRYLLIICLLISFGLPLLKVPQRWSFHEPGQQPVLAEPVRLHQQSGRFQEY